MAQKPCRQSQRLFQRKSRDPSCRAFPRHAYVVEGQYAVADDLPLFMPLASQQDNVVSTRLSNRRRNRLPTTADFDSAGGRRHDGPADVSGRRLRRSEEHTSELQSLMRISYAVFCLKKKNEI